MAKEVVAKIKLQAPGGQATPAPPIGPALGQHGVNIGQFVSQFNERTKELNGTIVPNKEKVGKITSEQLRKIAETKFKDLNAYDLDRAERIIAGTARSMGIEIIDS